jgi:DNA polymerase/3'-5' exonuclease PolX
MACSIDNPGLHSNFGWICSWIDCGANLSKGIGVPLGLAQTFADKLVKVLEPFCDEVRIAGSVRRMRPVVHDLEIVCLAHEHKMATLFGKPVAMETTSLDDALIQLDKEAPILGWRLDHEKQGKFNKRLIHKHTGFLCDIYVCLDQRAFGTWLMVRTGPRAFSIEIMKKARKLDMFFANGFLLHNHMPHHLVKNNRGYCKDGAACKLIIPLRRESDVFETLRMRYLTPEKREEIYGLR